MMTIINTLDVAKQAAASQRATVTDALNLCFLFATERVGNILCRGYM